jgi:hypothetical protein
LSDQLELNLDPSDPVETPRKLNALEKIAEWAKTRYYDPIAKMGKDAAAEDMAKSGKDRPSLKGAVKIGAKAGGESLASGLYGMQNEFLLGAPDAAIQAISRASGSDAYKKLKEFRKKYAMTGDIGSATGIVAGMAIPGGTGLNAAGKVAQAANMGRTAAFLGKANRFRRSKARERRKRVIPHRKRYGTRSASRCRASHTARDHLNHRKRRCEKRANRSWHRRRPWRACRRRLAGSRRARETRIEVPTGQRNNERGGGFRRSSD